MEQLNIDKAMEKLAKAYEGWKNVCTKKPQTVQDHISEKVEKHIEQILRTKANPPIRGKITKGKVKWRGIKFYQGREGLKIHRWVEQRGKQIGKTFTFSLGNEAC